MGTKISIVENLVLLISLVRLLCLIMFVVVATAVLPAYASNTTAATKGLVEYCGLVLMILPQVHLRKPCYDFSFL